MNVSKASIKKAREEIRKLMIYINYYIQGMNVYNTNVISKLEPVKYLYHNVDEDTRGINEDESCKSREMVRYPQCDGQDDVITYDTIPSGLGMCANEKCYNANSLDSLPQWKDPFTNQDFSEKEKKINVIIVV